MNASLPHTQPEGARDAEQRLALWCIHNPDAAAARIEELTKALRGLDTLMDFSDDNVGTTWVFEDPSGIQEAFAEAHRALSVTLEQRGTK